MMKPVNRIFLILGAMSMFSLFQFDAMGGNTKDGCKNVKAGKYCLEKGEENKCPPGCYCEGKKNSPAVANIPGLPSDMAVRYACAKQDPTTAVQLINAGVHYCGFGKTSPEKSDNGSDCETGETAYDGSKNCTGTVNAGHYCKKKDNHNKCPEGCYCDGSKNAVGDEWWNSSSKKWDSIMVEKWCNGHNRNYLTSYLTARGIHYCPEAFPDSDKKAEKIGDCYFTVNGIKVYEKNKYAIDVGYYFPKGTITQQACSCESGTQCYCPGKQSVSASKTQDVGREICPSNKVSNSNKTDCVCPNGTEWVAVRRACVSRYAVTYNCGDGTGTAPMDSYFVGATVTVKSNTCTAPSGRTFDKWNCGDSIGNKMPDETFIMPAENVICNAKWKSAGDNGGADQGGGTQGGGSHSCQPGQYWSDITAEAREVPIAVLRDTVNSTNRSAKKAATKSVVSRTAMQPLPVSMFDVSKAKALDAADLMSALDAADLRPALGGSCIDCEAGYYCPDGTQGRVACPEGTYTNTTRQTQCLVCNGTVTQTGNLNTGCSTDPDNPGNNYNVTYNCGDHGTGDLSNNGASHTSGTQVTTLASTACARNEGYTFSNWECMAGSIELSVNNAGQFTMPDADVTCTAQWSTGSNGGGNGNENEDAVCPVGQYLPEDGEDADDCEQCSGNYVCPGDDASYRCPWTVSGNTCGGILDAGQLKKGKSRNRDCWKFFNSPSDYRECVYGFSID